MLELLTGLFTSSGFGVITGLVGSYLSKREERKVLELRFSHENRMAKHDLQRDIQDHAHDLDMADKNMEEATLEGQIATDISEMDNVKSTIISQSKSSGNKVIDGILRFVRPVITAYLLVICTVLAFHLHKLTGGLAMLSTEQVFGLYSYILYQMVFLTVTAVAWWFGSRGQSSKPSLK